MKRLNGPMRRTLVIPALLLAACASRPAGAPKPAPAGPEPALAPTATRAAAIPSKVTTAADLTDHAGDSPEAAVEVPASEPNDGIVWERNWVFDRYGRFRVMKSGVAHAGEGPAERRYSILTIELPDGSKRTVYFDITEVWKAWKPPAR
jgi:hypothetical protein